MRRLTSEEIAAKYRMRGSRVPLSDGTVQVTGKGGQRLSVQQLVHKIPVGADGGSAQWAQVTECTNATQIVCKLCTGDYPELTVTSEEVTAAVGEGLYGKDSFVIVAAITGSADITHAVISGSRRWQFYAPPGESELAIVQDTPDTVDLCD